MSGVAGNLYTLAFKKQTAKGVAATDGTGVYKLKLTGGSLEPNRQLLTLQETDATRQQGDTVVVGAQIQGQPEWYVRPADFGLFSYAALGATSVTGTGVPYSHEDTPANSPPYLTCWRNVGGGTIVDKFTDIRVGSLEVSGGALQALQCRADLMGLGAVFGATDSAASTVNDHVFTYPEVCVSLGGSVPATVENFTVTINNNADFIQADCSLGPYDVVLGRLEVSGSFTYLLESDAAYRSFHTGNASGVAFSTTLFEQALSIAATAGDDSITIACAGIAYTAYPVQPDVSGKPIRVAATFSSLPQAAVADYIKITTNNSVASY